MVKHRTEKLDPLVQFLLWVGGLALFFTCCICGGMIAGWW